MCVYLKYYPIWLETGKRRVTSGGRSDETLQATTLPTKTKKD